MMYLLDRFQRNAARNDTWWDFISRDDSLPAVGRCSRIVSIIHRKHRYLSWCSDYVGRGWPARWPQSLAPRRSRTPAPRPLWSRAHAATSRSIHLFACTPYRVPIIALNLFRRSIDRIRLQPELRLEILVCRTRTDARASLVGWHQLSRHHVRCEQYALSVRGVAGPNARGSMDEGRCATCDALGRRSLSSKLLQVAIAQAHMKTCSHAASPPEQGHDSDLASRALAAKRRKSIAGFRLNLSHDAQLKPPPTTEPSRSHVTRRNTWCS